jgi:hypothetical protein
MHTIPSIRTPTATPMRTDASKAQLVITAVSMSIVMGTGTGTGMGMGMGMGHTTGPKVIMITTIMITHTRAGVQEYSAR